MLITVNCNRTFGRQPAQWSVVQIRHVPYGAFVQFRFPDVCYRCPAAYEARNRAINQVFACESRADIAICIIPEIRYIRGWKITAWLTNIRMFAALPEMSSSCHMNIAKTMIMKETAAASTIHMKYENKFS